MCNYIINKVILTHQNMPNIFTYWIHEQFSPLAEQSESLSVVENNWITLVIDCPDRSVNSLINDKKIASASTMSHIDYLLITHLDSDHISWLAKILWYKQFWEDSKLNLIAHPNIKKYLWRTLEWWFGQDRTKNIVARKSFEDYVNFMPLRYWELIDIPWFWQIEAFGKATKHSPNMDVLAVKVYDEAGENIANFSSDTAFDPELIEFLSAGDWPIIHEAGAYVEEWSHSHTSIKELIEKVSRNVQERIFLNHIPAQKEQQVRDAIRWSGSPLRLAEEFYADNVKESILKVKNAVTFNEVLYPGSFDPFTNWHLSVLRRQLRTSKNDHLTILVAVNPDKKWVFSAEERVFLIEKCIPYDIRNRVKVVPYAWVVADYQYLHNISTVIKWLRDAKDFNYELEIAAASNRFSGEVNTVFLPQIDNSLSNVSSSMLKKLLYYWWDVRWYADPMIIEALRMKLTNKWISWVTWSIGSGKTTFCTRIVEESLKNEVPVHYINLDKLWHEIHTRTDFPLFMWIRQRIADKFWYWVLNADGTTNRKKLWEFVFSSKQKLDDLMDIMLEPMLFLLREKLEKLGEWDWIVLVEWAILTERKLTYLFDENMIDISIPLKLQYQRVWDRDKLTSDQIERRLSTQLANEDRADMIIRNQASSYDRLYMAVDWADYDTSAEYAKLLSQFKRRKNIIR
ncbi:MAG: pantetheine-phosphate adenylyltransferase [uncultured bacterium (gcode 4)]|uniref:Phosphopantetheine adenylyltransferase n=1 Tax=uncultured bacterium (gcode 4) TaxID=1234023 RepID=K2G316_9BACT|nr:MAG: pantetheine-phosphate adenylyltransferase [uncultured bacterium (gcode 4)]